MEQKMITGKEIFCSEIQSVNIRDLVKKCRSDNCACDISLRFGELTDLFAHLYFILDGANYADYVSIKRSEPDKYGTLDREIKKRCRAELERSIVGSCQSFSIYTDFNTQDILDLIKQFLASCRDKYELLLTVTNWLFVLDEFFGQLLESSSKKRESVFPKPTFRGTLLRKNLNTLSDILFEDEAMVFDPEIELKDEVTSIYLIRDHGYAVEYHSLSRAVSEKIERYKANPLEMRIAFIPGIMSSLDQFEWDIYETEQGNLFRLKDILIEGYRERINSFLTEVMDKSPDLIIFPELSAPIDLQRSIVQQVIDVDPTMVVIPGSFHVEGQYCGTDDQEGQFYYNYSEIYTGNANRCKLFKTHPFILKNGTGFEGKLSVLNGCDSIERIDIKRKLRIIPTPIGNMAIIICVDLLIGEVEKTLVNHDVKLLIVMALTGNPAGGQFELQMKQLGKKSGTTVFICNNPAFGSVTTTVYFPIRHGIYQGKERPALVETIGEMLAKTE
ncbi:hypothetical protein B1A99_02020 [Cohnella sp. CIP 111063]|uniref:hypothetical protein n=1 Tax=unclassified Cohnella TaxID=2636738 RepID=UPI000B8C03CF|nr:MULTISPECIES: hypothetical protein [unclassified Cohnella]OXS62657.1 hypothetical protein B1A99_02020 [Cohnella sp. CIP 111063]